MNLILVAIDFSKASLHALKYAIFFANQVEADVLMIWVDNQSTTENIFSDASAELRDESKRALKDIVEQHAPLLKKGKLSFKLRKGKVYFEIAQQARMNKANLIISGTHGVTGYEKFWIGSNAYRIVTNAPCPVITVRNQYDFSSGINNIVLPIDSTKNTLQKIPFTIKLAEYFNSNIHMLAMYSTTLKSLHKKVDNSANHTKKILDKHKIECSCSSIFADNITKSAIEYSNNINAELICMMTEQDTTASNILLGEFAQQMVNNSLIPICSIHPSKI